MKKYFSLFLFLAFISNFVQAAQSQSLYQTYKLAPHAYVISQKWNADTGGNMGVVIGDTGLVLINTLMLQGVAGLEAELKKLSDKPVKYVVNSNWDPYNNNANEYFADKGAIIITQKDMQYWPVYHQVLFEKELTLHLGSETIHLKRSPAHSFGHINVFLEKANVVFMADSFRNDWMTTTGPNGIAGHIAGLEQVLNVANEETVIVPGNHGDKPLSTLADLQKEKVVREAFIKQFLILHENGKNTEQLINAPELAAIIRKAYPTRDFSVRGNILRAIHTELEAPYSPKPKEILALVGQYQLGKNIIEILIENEKLVAQSKNRFKMILRPVSATKYELLGTTKGEHFAIHFNQNDNVIGITPMLEDSFYQQLIPAGVWKKQ